MKRKSGLWTVAALLTVSTITASAADIKGKVVDRQTKEPLIGATVMIGDKISGTEANKGAATDIDGAFNISGLKKGSHLIIIKYVGYKPVTMKASATDIANGKESGKTGENEI